MLNWPHNGFKALRAGRTPACHASQTTMADQCHLADTRRYFAKTTQGHCGQVERPTSNVEWEKMKKQTYDLEKRLLEYSVRIKLNCGAKRHHYSMFNVGRSMLDVHLPNQARMA